MNNDEIKALLKELSDKAAAEGKVKSRVVDITFDKKKPARKSSNLFEDKELSDDDQRDEQYAQDDAEYEKGTEKKKKSIKGLFASLGGAFSKDDESDEEPEDDEYLDEPEDEEDVFISVLPKSDGRFVIRDPKMLQKETPAAGNEQADDTQAKTAAEKEASASEEESEESDWDEEMPRKSVFGFLRKKNRPDTDEESDEYDDEETESEEDEETGADDEQSSLKQEESEDFGESKKIKMQGRSMHKIHADMYAPDFESDAQAFRSESEETEGDTAAFRHVLSGWFAKNAEAAAERKRIRAKKKAQKEAEKEAEKEALHEEMPAAENTAEQIAKQDADEAGADEEKHDLQAVKEPAGELTHADAEEENPVSDMQDLPADEHEQQETEHAENDVKAPAQQPSDDQIPEKEEQQAEEPEVKKEKQQKAPKPEKTEKPAREKRVKTGKKIAAKEIIMIVVGVLLVALIAVMVVSITASQKKSMYVESESGLTVTVEQEPDQWCTNGEVILGVRTSSAIQSITVNGVAQEFEGKKSAKITVQADAQVLNVMVVTEEKVLNAIVSLQKLDSEDPSLNIQTTNGVVTLEASDNGSGLEGVYYGVLEGLSDVVEYERYTSPFVPQEGKSYSCYARDIAGNTTTPVVTNLKNAENIALKSEEIMMFPGDTYQLVPVLTPEGSYANGLKMESSDSSVISLTGSGQITALREGEATVSVSAPGLSTVSCVVRVRSQIDITISAVGDLTLGDDVSFNPATSFSAAAKANGLDFFLANVKDVFTADDLTFANFEGTLTEQGSRVNKTFAFRGSPEYTRILTDASVDVVTLANNHSKDYGDVSLEDTKQYLTEAGIGYCIGDVISMQTVNGIRVAMIGIYGLDDKTNPEQLMKAAIAMAKQQGAQIIVTAFHWGSEKASTPDSKQQMLAHAAIDAGADLVVGHHPHVLQGIEQYNGKYIAYSLGNFCFGGNSTPSDMDTIIFQETFTMVSGGTISDTRVNIIPCSISSVASANNYQPTPATGSEAERIKAKLNELCQPYGTSF